MTDKLRTRYQHDYYVRNKHRKKYTYVKKGVMKRLPPAQYEILTKMRQGFTLYKYHDSYKFHIKGLYYTVNLRSVECLFDKGYIEMDGPNMAKVTLKGSEHKQSKPKKQTV